MNRIAAIDIARTVAILAMAVFHFTYDLELFGFVPSGTMRSDIAVWSARLIAGTFIFVSGISLVIAHPFGVTAWRSTLIRLGKLGLAAAAVTIGTYVAMGDAFVRFGVLHCLLAASLLGLTALRVPYWATGVAGLAILTLPLTEFWPLLDSTVWLWLAPTQQPVPMMVDYVPVLPWFGVFLLGMSAGRVGLRSGFWDRLRHVIPAGRSAVRILSWPGQHSLAIYLIHQPILFGLVYLARMLL